MWEMSVDVSNVHIHAVVCFLKDFQKGSLTARAEHSLEC